ncbi:Protein NLP2 [Dendrobium catenatum]|uniref:Protein NLP2 n=1 Tax=Dendrobium catenatum TaxID=906689 RepID=A0A2I0VW06_9ASPA|nr:Protein NLP2 [Dendrobium catenatum]
MAMDCGAGSPTSEDLLNMSGLLNLDWFNDSSSSLSSDLLFSSFNYSSLHPLFGNSASLTSPCGLEQATDSVLEDERASGDGDCVFRENLAAQKPILQSEYSPNSAKKGEVDSVEKAENGTSSVILKSIGDFTFSDRMLKALSLLKESSGGGILAQVWIPVKQGDNYMLSTSEQPFLLDNVLAGYREVSRIFTFSAKETPGMFPGVPGRVFISGLPEWTSNVLYYNKFEYLRVQYAISHDVRGSLAVPVFDPHQSGCRAVLELVTMKEKSNFNVEMENVCRALQAVDLRTTKSRVHHQNLTKEQRSALSEILDVLRAVCHAHMLPLALTWMPKACNPGTIDDDVAGSASTSKAKPYLMERMLCLQESACYVNDSQMHGFLQACAEHYLTKGQGIAGKALLSNHPFFSPDVKGYDIGDYPLVHHARKFGLHAAVAIRLRSTYTGDDDFILELFLPLNCKGAKEQQLLLSNLSVTMQKICMSLRTVLDTAVVRPDAREVDTENFKVTNSMSSEIAGRYSQPISERNLTVADVSSQDQNMDFDEQVLFLASVLYPDNVL